MKILVLGASGMLGSAVFKSLSICNQVYGTVRSDGYKSFFPEELHSNLISNLDVLNQDSIINLMDSIRPDAVINCVGLIKQFSGSNDPLHVLPINALFPHRLAGICGLQGSRLIHISTDCVYSGSKGMYEEQDESDAKDLYGKSKYIGELHEYKNSITLRTSIIGHELNSNVSLIDWFLLQEGKVKGFTKAVFSGLPTVELARLINEYVLPNTDLSGLYHVSSEPIDKYSLLNLVKNIYSKDIEIIPSNELVIDRSLNSSYFRGVTGYEPRCWSELVKFMHENRDRD